MILKINATLMQSSKLIALIIIVILNKAYSRRDVSQENI